MVSFAARDARPHPEERGRRRSSANSNVRTRVSKDEDGRLFAPMLRDASQRIWAVEAAALASRCDAPQHEGEGGAAHFGEAKPTGILPIDVVPAKAGTHDHRRWLWVPALRPPSRASAGTTIAWSVRSTNL